MTLQIDNLVFHYEHAPLLHHVSLQVAAGECVALFGPNGGGKTTFLKLLMGFLKPISGSIKIGGEPPVKKRCQMGYVPQISQLDRQFPMTVLEVVKMGALSPSWFRSYPPECSKTALDMLAKVGLLQLAEAPFGSLSGGQLQRVLIARALMGNPHYLFLDEATAHIDVSAQEAFHALIKALKGTLTVVMVTHDLPTVLPYVDRFFCVHQTVMAYSPLELCHHFAQGLYHPPLSPKEKR